MDTLISFFKRTCGQCLRFKHALSFFLLFFVSAFMLFISWQKWPDILVDFGRELYVPWQISQGKVLYKDMAYFYGPLSPYLNAVLFKIFGVHLMTLAVFNIIVIFILAFIIYRIFISLTDWPTATSAGGTFLAVFAFSQYVHTGNYNFVCPYTYAVTYSVFLSFLMMQVYLSFLSTQKKMYLLLMGLLMGLIFLTKPEVFFAAVMALAAGIWFLIMDKAALLKASEILGLVCLGFFLPVVLVVVYFSNKMPFREAAASILSPYTDIFSTKLASIIFFRHIMGTDAPFSNLLKLAQAAKIYLALFMDFALIGYGIRRISRRNCLFWGGIILFGLFILFKIGVMPVSFLMDYFFRPLPLAVLVLGVYLFVSLVRRRHDHKQAGRLMALLVMSIFAFFLILKMGLNVHLYHYGFALAMPATLLLVSIGVYFLPIVLGQNERARFSLRMISIVLLGVLVFRCARISENIYTLKTFAVGGGGVATIYDFNPPMSQRGNYTRLAIGCINKIVKTNENFVVFPEGVMLNYLTRRVNPTPYVNFMATENMIFGEGKMLDSFKMNKPDYVILIDKDLSEYGCSGVEKNCGYPILNWIKKNYSPVVKIGSVPLTGKGFGIVICKRGMNPS